MGSMMHKVVVRRNGQKFVALRKAAESNPVGEILWDERIQGPANDSVMAESSPEPLGWKEERALEFAKIDALKEEALVESVVEGRNEKLEEYKALRAAIKLRIPKV